MQTLLSLRYFVTFDSSKKSQNFKVLYPSIRVKYRPDFFCKLSRTFS